MHLYPPPKSIEPRPGHLPLNEAIPASFGFEPSPRFLQSLRCFDFLDLSQNDRSSTPLQLKLLENSVRDELYCLTIDHVKIELEANSETGLYRGLSTLQQLARSSDRNLPCSRIEDQPDLAVRGYMLDISRCKVPKLETLYKLIDHLAVLKFNQLQLYTEHTFAYRDHETVWENASPLTADDIRSLDAYCSNRYIEFVPNQNSFGHMERWLRHDPYKHLAECPNGYEHPILGPREFGGTLKPNKASLEFVATLYDELLPNFASDLFNIGGDEPWELGQGWSAEAVQAKGKHRVYLDFLLSLHAEVSARGKTMQFWGDIILEEPELAKELPSNSIGIIWGYEADHPFGTQCVAFRNSGVPYYVAPGTSAWNTIGGRYENAVANIKEATAQAIRFNANGMLLTDWGDFGHHHFPPVSYPALVWAAALSWNHESASQFNDIHAINTIFFDGQSEELANSIVKLGTAQNHFSHNPANRMLLNDLLFATPEKLSTELEKTNPKELQACHTELLDTRNFIEQANAPTDNARQSKQELLLATDLLILAAEKGLAGFDRSKMPTDSIQALIARYRELWLARNRPGGLEESISYLRKFL